MAAPDPFACEDLTPGDLQLVHEVLGRLPASEDLLDHMAAIRLKIRRAAAGGRAAALFVEPSEIAERPLALVEAVAPVATVEEPAPVGA